MNHSILYVFKDIVIYVGPNIEPLDSFFIAGLGFPKFQQIFDHLCYLSLESRKETISEDELQETFQTDEPVFLNGENPFTDSWKSGNQLVFDIPGDIDNNLCKVKPNLEPYKRLLKASGAKELKGINYKVKVGEYSQRDKLLKRLDDGLAGHPATRHHDVIFKVGDEEMEEIDEEIEIYLEIDNKIMVGREVIRISNIILNIWVNSIQNGVSIINNYNDSGDEADIKT
ncbi:18425_t:CDS:2 [Entrophospora sp. SA101]|nr:18425_t:CDS:2 [Entrophospora sp. SA101]